MVALGACVKFAGEETFPETSDDWKPTALRWGLYGLSFLAGVGVLFRITLCIMRTIRLRDGSARHAFENLLTKLLTH